MRSSQAALRLAGGLASAMVAFAGILAILIDFLPALFRFEICNAMHCFADATLLVLGGVTGVLAEICPHPVVSENAPYLSKLSGRAYFYFLAGMYIIGRKPHGWQAWGDFTIGFFTLCVSMIAMSLAYRMQGLPSSLTEPVLQGQEPQQAELTSARETVSGGAGGLSSHTEGEP